MISQEEWSKAKEQEQYKFYVNLTKMISAQDYRIQKLQETINQHINTRYEVAHHV